ncbi:hypothetical protein ZOSMA_56G01590 [Zostera marina]|uniref:VQ domain-containing protein n=1 Tax=Zostera marina TaxID=29655 RepID=A0A0K9NYB0_ZOSMR|nr:hypothetical protein ZOSMA_56G01590 [Zostera marina]
MAGTGWDEIYNNTLSMEQPATGTTNSSYIGPGTGPVRGKPRKKRTRVSKKFPTTLLDTNTANFQVMVQRFTGLQPDPPMVNYHHQLGSMNHLSNSSNYVADPFGTRLRQPQPYPHAPSAHRQHTFGVNYDVNGVSSSCNNYNYNHNGNQILSMEYSSGFVNPSDTSNF